MESVDRRDFFFFFFATAASQGVPNLIMEAVFVAHRIDYSLGMRHESDTVHEICKSIL